MKETIEQAAREYAKRYSSEIHNDGRHTVIPSYTARNSFEAGAEWQSNQSPWISVEEQLPPDLHKNVLLKVENCGVLVGLGLNIKENDLKITHWMEIKDI